MQYLDTEQAEKVMKAWRETPHQPNGTPVSIIYRTNPQANDAVCSELTLVLIGGHAIGLVNYMAVEQGASPRPYVFLVQTGGFALRLPLGHISVEPIGVDHTAEIAESEKLPVPPEWTEWQNALEAYRKTFERPVARQVTVDGKTTTKISDWNRATTRLEDVLAQGATPCLTRAQIEACCEPDRPNGTPTTRLVPWPNLVMGVRWSFMGDTNPPAVAIGAWNADRSVFRLDYYKTLTGLSDSPIGQAKAVAKIARKAGVVALGADWGCGSIQNAALQHELGAGAVIQLWYTGSAERLARNAKTGVYHLGRGRVITEAIDGIKRGRILFPRAMDCVVLFDPLGAEQAYVGDAGVPYHCSTAPDGLLHAAIYAMMAGEITATPQDLAEAQP